MKEEEKKSDSFPGLCPEWRRSEANQAPVGCVLSWSDHPLLGWGSEPTDMHLSQKLC